MKVLTDLQAWAMNVLLAGERREMDTAERSKIIFLNSVTLAGGLMIALFAVIGFRSGNTILGTACAIASTIVFVNFFGIRIFRKYTLGAIVDCIVIFLFYFYLAYSGGEGGSGVLWSMTYPLITLFLLGTVWGSGIAIAYGVAIGIVIFHPKLNLAGFVPLYSTRVIGTYFFIWLFAFIYEEIRRTTQARLQAANESLLALSAELRTEKKQGDDILANVLEGIFLLDADFRIGKAHSAWLEHILERSISENDSLLDILAPLIPERDLASTKDYFDLFLSGQVNEDLLQDINPIDDIPVTFDRGKGELITKRLHFQFIRVADPSAPWPILGVLVDRTKEHELKLRLEQEEDVHRKAMESVFEIIHIDPNMLREFIGDTDSEIDAVNELMKEGSRNSAFILQELFQMAHAIKGNAALLGLKSFAERVHAFETRIKGFIDGGHQWKNLLELTIDLAEIKESLEEIRGLITKILQFQSDTKASGLEDCNLVRYSLEKLIKREAERKGLAVDTEFVGFTRDSVPGSYRKLLKDVLNQFIRNSFAHGFESAQERKAAGKSDTALISLNLEYKGNAIYVRYRDNGRGLDVPALRERAKALPEYAGRAESLKQADLARLIFMPGFSTSASSDLSAGRGVGMSLVKSRVQEAGGKIAIRSASGQFMEFTIVLPLKMPEEMIS